MVLSCDTVHGYNPMYFLEKIKKINALQIPGIIKTRTEGTSLQQKSNNTSLQQYNVQVEIKHQINLEQTGLNPASTHYVPSTHYIQ